MNAVGLAKRSRCRMLSEVREGEVLAGKYRIERVIGRGGTGVVVAARHLQLDQRVALKFLLPLALRHPEAVARFGREARSAARLESEHVARVIEVGTLDDGVPFMVMEYLQGTDLSRRIAAEGPIPVQEAAALLLQACEALAEAHSLGIVHRDLKPANLFLTRSPDGTTWIKILNFGISKLTAAGNSAAEFDLTNTAAVMGSPYYMSPEQMRSMRDVDARTDIWALGIIIYELVSGRVPFAATSMPQLCGMVLQEAPPPLRALRPEISERFEALVFRCLEKDVALRFQTVAEVAFALAEFAPNEAAHSLERISRLSGGPAGMGKAPSEPVRTESHGATQTDFSSTSARRSSSSKILALILFAAAGSAFAAFWILRNSSPSELSRSPDAARPESSAHVEATRGSASTPSRPPPSPGPNPSSSPTLARQLKANATNPASPGGASAPTARSSASQRKAIVPNPQDGRL